MAKSQNTRRLTSRAFVCDASDDHVAKAAVAEQIPKLRPVAPRQAIQRRVSTPSCSFLQASRLDPLSPCLLDLKSGRLPL